MPMTKSERNKIYYQNNKDKIISHLGEKKRCEVCNREYPIYHLYRHYKSKKHITNESGLKQ